MVDQSISVQYTTLISMTYMYVLYPGVLTGDTAFILFAGQSHGKVMQQS